MRKNKTIILVTLNLILAISLIFALSGCEQALEQQNAQEQQPTAQTPQETTQETPRQDSGLTIGMESPVDINDIEVGIGTKQMGEETLLSYWYINRTEFPISRFNLYFTDETGVEIRMVSGEVVEAGEQSTPQVIWRDIDNESTQMQVDELALLENATRVTMMLFVDHAEDAYTVVEYNYTLDAYTITVRETSASVPTPP